MLFGKTAASSFLDLRIRDLAWMGVFILLFFQPALQDAFSQASWLDEIATIAIAICAVFRITGNGIRVSASAKLSILLLIGFSLTCLLGNALSGIPVSWQPVAVDAFTCVKFFITLLAGVVVFHRNKTLFVVVSKSLKIVLFVIGLCAMVSLVFDIGMSYNEVRYGFHPFDFVFSHPTYLAVALSGAIVVLSVESEQNTRWIMLAAVLLILTFRGKAMGFVAFVVLVILMTRGGRKALRLWQIIAIGIVVLIIGWGQIESYFGTEGQARAELLRAGLQIADDHFPIGMGFATFGSAVTSDPEWYSPVYVQYGLSSVWGLSPEYSSYISDSFWPTVLGQSGWAGFLMLLGTLFLLFFSFFKRSNNKLPVLFCFAYLIITSTSESSFFNPSSVYLAICVALACFSWENESGQHVAIERLREKTGFLRNV